MKVLFLFQFFIFKTIISNTLQNYIKNEQNETKLKDIFLQLILYEKDNISKIINTPKINSSCSTFLKENYILNETDESSINKTYLYYLKLVFDSSKNKNDISTYRDCMRKRYGIKLRKKDINNYSYVLVFIDKRNETQTLNNDDTTYLFALCLAYKNDTCHDNDYKKIFLTFFENYANTTFKESEITIFSFENTSNEYVYHFISFDQIPLYFVILILFLMLFKKWIFKCNYCSKKEKDIEKDKEKKTNEKRNRDTIMSDKSPQPNLSKKTNYQKIFENVFSFFQNIDILFSNENEENIYNDTGISYIKGMKGLSMIFYLLGTLFFNLYNSPISQKTKRQFYLNLGNFLNSFFYIGLKYSPRILLSCSGYSLFYKLTYYLDEKTEEEREERINKEKKHSFIHYTNINMLFTFIIHQIYKYILFLFVLFFMIYTIFNLNLFFIDINPMWVYFENSLIKTIKFTQLIPLLFGFQAYYFHEKEQQYQIINYFWLVYNEIFYFLITTFILYFVYKKNLPLYGIIIGLFISIEVSKFIFVYFGYKLNTALIYTFNNYGKFHVTSLMNYPYFLIGVYFSMFNYSMQKRLNYGDCEKQRKDYLKRIIKKVKKLINCQKINLYKWGILFIILFIIFSFSPFFIFTFIRVYNNNNLLNTYFNNDIIKFILMYDTEIIVILFHLFVFFFNFEENFIKHFFTHRKWNLLDRTYFSYILLINPVILYILYTGETKIQFNVANCILYSLISFFFLFFFSTLFYVIFELPFKRLIKYKFKIKKNQKNEEILGNIEEKFNNSKNDNNLFNITDIEEEENEEEVNLTNKVNKL